MGKRAGLPRCRTPQGVRGLKLHGDVGRADILVSHPARGAWIEMLPADFLRDQRRGRTPQGVRGLKCQQGKERAPIFRRTPQGVRGLKS